MFGFSTGGGSISGFSDINPAKVALVYNTSIAQSLTDANDYVTRRGLNSAFLLPVNFGTTVSTVPGADLANSSVYSVQSGTYSGQSVITALKNMIAASAIECVLCSTYTPPSVSLAGDSLNAALSAVLGAAPYWNKNGMSAVSPSTTQQSIAGYQAMVTANGNWRAAAIALGMFPGGRLGMPVNISTEVSLAAGGTTVYNNAVTNALAGESANQQSKPHILTDTLNYNIITAASNAAALQWARANGMATVNAGTDFNFSTFSTGTLSTPIDIFAYCIGVQFNVAGANFPTNFTMRSGGWWYNWTSGANVSGAIAAANGASAVIGTVSEPLNTGIPEPQTVFSYVTGLRCSLVLAAYLAGCVQRYTTYGDPLYRIYKSTTLVAA